MEIIFGRDSASGRLKIVLDGKEMLSGSPNSVDCGVSRQHCKLEIDDNGNKILTNLKQENFTFLNGSNVIKKKFELDDKTVIELGANRYRLELAELLKKMGMKETFSIGHLKRVIDDYRAAKLNMQISERKQNAMRGLMPVFMALAGVLGFTGILPGELRVIPSVCSLLLSCYFGYVGFVAASKNPIKAAELDKEFRQKYVCPNPQCGRTLNGEYENLLKAGECPFCHSKYKA